MLGRCWGGAGAVLGRCWGGARALGRCGCGFTYPSTTHPSGPIDRRLNLFPDTHLLKLPTNRPEDESAIPPPDETAQDEDGDGAEGADGMEGEEGEDEDEDDDLQAALMQSMQEQSGATSQPAPSPASPSSASTPAASAPDVMAMDLIPPELLAAAQQAAAPPPHSGVEVLRLHPQFAELKRLVRANPAALTGVLQVRLGSHAARAYNAHK